MRGAAVHEAAGTGDHRIRHILKFREEIFRWCLREALGCTDRGEAEEALQWDQLAARVACMDCACLASAELEGNILSFAPLLPVPDRCVTPGAPRRWLHVFSEAGSSAGHSAMAWRWMSLDPERSTHSVVVLSQPTGASAELVEMVSRRGGEIVYMNPREPILSRATRLRRYAWANADVVVLHVHSWEVAATLAFGTPGGPPVLLVNHAAHLFGVGGSIADLMINTRQSPQEDAWSREYRGMGDRLASLPLPLPDPAWGERTPELKAWGRRTLDLPMDAPVLLSVGNAYKYTPVPGLDFLECARTILRERPTAHLLVAGVPEDARWREARLATGGRLRGMGIQLDLKPFYAAADVYLEGFPVGSMTAALEAGHHGLPCVLSPAAVPPPFGTDGQVYDDAGVSQPETLERYITRALRLIDDRVERERCGRALAESVAAHHTGPGWQAKLEVLKQRLPATHEVRPLSDLPPLPWPLVAFWGAVSTRVKTDALGIVYSLAVELGLRPRLDRALRAAVKTAKPVRALHPPLRWLISCIDASARMLPTRCLSWVYGLYPALADVLRGNGLLTRTYRSLLGSRRTAS